MCNARIFVAIILLTGVNIVAGSAIRIDVSGSPALPGKNYIVTNADFSNGLKSWGLDAYSQKNGNIKKVVEDGRHAVEIKNIDRRKGSLGRSIPQKDMPLKPGNSYVIACMMKSKNGKGLNTILVFYSKDWKTSKIVTAGGDTKGKWMKFVSKPLKVEDWYAFSRLILNANYSKAEGFISNVGIYDAYTEISIKIKSPVLDIKQVVVENENGQIVLESDVFDAGVKSYAKTLKVFTPYEYKISVVDADGDIHSIKYPNKINRKENMLLKKQ